MTKTESALLPCPRGHTNIRTFGVDYGTKASCRECTFSAHYDDWNATDRTDASPWIAVDTPPEVEGEYLVTAHWSEEPFDCAFVTTSTFDVDNGTWVTEPLEGGSLSTVIITHWQPMPAPPKG